MASEKDQTQRRVYVLPTELVERIQKFQEDKRLPSEVEAARRLLDEALMQRDSVDDIIDRFLARLKTNGLLSDVAKEVLVGHPKIDSLRFNDGEIVFEVGPDNLYSVRENGTVFVHVGDDRWTLYERTADFGRTSPMESRRRLPPPNNDIDDDIPF